MDRPKLVIGNKNYSSWSLRAWLLLAKLNVDFEEVRLPLGGNEFKNRVSEYSPAGRVPVYVDGNTVVWDSLAISEYLAESHPGLLPSERAPRACARSITAEMHSGFDALRREMPMNCRARGRTVPKSRALADDIARIMAIFSDCRRASCHAGPWLFGDFSIADAAFAPVAFRFRTYGVSGSSESVDDYLRFVLQDPEIQRWLREAEEERDVIDEVEVGAHPGVREPECSLSGKCRPEEL